MLKMEASAFQHIDSNCYSKKISIQKTSKVYLTLTSMKPYLSAFLDLHESLSQGLNTGARVKFLKKKFWFLFLKINLLEKETQYKTVKNLQ